MHYSLLLGLFLCFTSDCWCSLSQSLFDILCVRRVTATTELKGKGHKAAAGGESWIKKRLCQWGHMVECFRFDWKHLGDSKKAAIETSLAAKYRSLIKFSQLSTLSTQHCKRITSSCTIYMNNTGEKKNNLNVICRAIIQKFHWKK